MNNKSLLVGFGRESITPATPVHMQGGSWRTRISTGVLDDIFATCVALRMDGQTMLVYTLDLKLPTPNFVLPAKAAVSAATGIKEDNILFTATHTHSSVAIRYPWEGVEEYKQMFYEQAVKAAKTAIADLSEAAVLAGSTETDRMAFVRHYRMNDGTVAGSNFGSWESGIADHIRPADGQLQLVRFARQGKKDVLLLSFPAHGTFNEGGLLISADFPSPTRAYLEENCDVLVAQFIGAAGDQTPGSRIPGRRFSKDYVEYGKRLGQYAQDALPTLTAAEASEIRLLSRTITAPTNKMKLDKLPEALRIKEIVEQTGIKSPELTAALKEYGISSRHEANWIVIRSQQADTKDLTLKVLSLGGLAFAFAPYEMFGHHGKDIKEGSPFPHTVIIGCEDGLNYMASEESFDYGCNESLCCFFARGTAEKMVQEYLDMLHILKSAAH